MCELSEPFPEDRRVQAGVTLNIDPSEDHLLIQQRFRYMNKYTIKELYFILNQSVLLIRICISLDRKINALGSDCCDSDTLIMK